MSKKLDIDAGEIYGRLEIIKEVSAIKSSRIFQCKCVCGNIVDTRLNSLRSGNTTSCGCYHKERIKQVNTTHGLRSHPLYHVWYNMIRRCYNKKHHQYKYYGGRGITVYEGWLGSQIVGLVDFIKWNDSLPNHKRWRENLELDRKNNNKGYHPNNCRWINKRDNLNNRRVTPRAISPKTGHLLTLKTLVKTEGVKGLTYKRAKYRFIELGWPIDKVLSKPKQKNQWNEIKLNNCVK